MKISNLYRTAASFLLGTSMYACATTSPAPQPGYLPEDVTTMEEFRAIEADRRSKPGEVSEATRKCLDGLVLPKNITTMEGFRAIEQARRDCHKKK